MEKLGYFGLDFGSDLCPMGNKIRPVAHKFNKQFRLNSACSFVHMHHLTIQWRVWV